MSATFAFYKHSGRLADKLVRLATASPYSHIEILRTPPVNGGAECISASKRDENKVRWKRIQFTEDHWDFVTVAHLDGSEVWEVAVNFLHTPYSNLGALLSVTPIHYRSYGHRRIFCSELAAITCHLPDSHRYTPGSFHRWASQNVVIAGEISAL